MVSVFKERALPGFEATIDAWEFNLQILWFYFFQISTNVQVLTVAVLILATTLLVRSLVHVQVASSWILGKEAAEVRSRLIAIM